MSGRRAARTVFAAALAWLLYAPARAQPAQPIPDAPCAPHESADVAVASVTDGRTFKTADGREVRLAAIEPIAGRRDDAAQDKAARAALARTLGTAVELVQTGAADRYGRLPAYAFRRGSGTQQDTPSWVERDLVAKGYAVAGGAVATGDCLSRLLEAEGEARAARRGLWEDPNFAIRNADDGAALALGQGQFIISQGKILSVREVGGTIYMNFGKIWRRSLTVTIGKRTERAFRAAGIEPKRLEGHQVRVRGWLDRRIGPTIEAERPEQIELID